MKRRVIKRVWTWTVAEWPKAIPAMGFVLGTWEVGGNLLFRRPLNPGVIPFAAALIVWQPLRDRQRQRNQRTHTRRKDD